MKTQIIQLDPYDDTISIKDKMVWAKTPRILLVWPGRRKILRGRLDLLLLLRHSNSFGAQLGIVTRDPDVLFDAQQLGISTFTNIRKAQKSIWKLPPKADHRGHKQLYEKFGRSSLRTDLVELKNQIRGSQGTLYSNFIFRLFFFLLGVFSLLSIVALLFPKADIYLTPRVRQVSVSLDVRANPDIRSIKLSGEVPAFFISVEVEEQDILKTSGEVTIPKWKSSGSVVVTNLTDQPITLNIGTIVKTDGENTIQFATERTASIPPGPNESITFPIEALSPGSSGNVPANSITTIESRHSLNLTVTNPSPTAGGSDHSVSAPSQSDHQTLYNQITKNLRQTALYELQKRIAQDDHLQTSTLSLSRLLAKKVEPKDTQPSDYLSMSLKLEFKALVISGKDLHDLSYAVLSANIPYGFTPIADSIVIGDLSSIWIENSDTIKFLIDPSWQLEANLDDSQVINLIIGQNLSSAQSRLINLLPLNSPPQISMNPLWWPRLPYLPFRISIVKH